MVRHRGLPGWTAAAMLDNADDDESGLRAALRKIRDPAPALAVVLAGTNDLGYGPGVGDLLDSITVHPAIPKAPAETAPCRNRHPSGERPFAVARPAGRDM